MSKWLVLDSPALHDPATGNLAGLLGSDGKEYLLPTANPSTGQSVLTLADGTRPLLARAGYTGLENSAMTPLTATKQGVLIPGNVQANLTTLSQIVCRAPVAAIGFRCLAGAGVIEFRENSVSGRLLTKANLAVTSGDTVYFCGTGAAEFLSGDLYYRYISGTGEIEPLFDPIDGPMFGPDGEVVVADPGASGLIYVQGPLAFGPTVPAANWSLTAAAPSAPIVYFPAELLGLRVLDAVGSPTVSLYEGPLPSVGRRIMPAALALVAGTNVFPWGQGTLKRLNGGVCINLDSGTSCEVAPLYRPVDL